MRYIFPELRKHQWIEVPNLWPSPLRPVIDLKAPEMSYNSSEADKDLQARIIASALSGCPSEHTGLTHVTSKIMAHSVAFRLGKLTNRRLFVPDEDVGTEEIYEQWMNIKNDGTIFIGWQARVGWDCSKDHINILGKVPFTPIKFEKDDKGRNKKDANGRSIPIGFDTHRYVYDYAAAMSRIWADTQQALGRIRRGNLEDYGSNKAVFIADSNYKRLSEFIPDDMGII